MGEADHIRAKRSKMFHTIGHAVTLLILKNWFVGLLCCSIFLDSAHLGKGIKSISVVGVPPIQQILSPPMQWQGGLTT
jgi:hypothetical protein